MNKNSRLALLLVYLFLLSNDLFAKMLILNADSCSKGVCTKSQNFSDKSIQSFSVKKSSSKSLNSTKVQESDEFEIRLNEEIVSVKILDRETSSDFIALLKQKGTSLYALYATSGTAGRYYHYFNIEENQTSYLGFYPELIHIDSKDNNEFISFEKDASRSIKSHWKLKQGKLLSISKKVSP